MQKNAWIALGIFVCFVFVVGLCLFIRKKEDYMPTVSKDSSVDFVDEGIDDIEIVDNEEPVGFGTGPGLYGSGRHTSESYGY